MKQEHIEQSTQIFKMLSDPTRMKVLDVLFAANGELCVHEIADYVGISHSATSHQLSKLEDKGIVECYRKGQTVCYMITKSDISDQVKKLMYICQK